jgi:elongation factor G
VTYRRVKQDGGAGPFAVVTLDVEPRPGAPDGAEGFAFESTVAGGAVPREYVRAVEAGCRDALEDGPLGGYPVTGLRVRLTDGATHVKDSSELAFRVAGRLATAQALRRCRMRLLEPLTRVSVTVPEPSLGAVLGDLASRRGRILGWPGDGSGDGSSEGAGVDGSGAAIDGGSRAGAGTVRVTADVPLQELFGYATVLRSRTSGRGTVRSLPSGYAAVPDDVSRQVLGQ